MHGLALRHDNLCVKTVAEPSLFRNDERRMACAANFFISAGRSNQTVFHSKHAIECRLHCEDKTTGHSLENCRAICELAGETVPVNSFHLIHVKMAASKLDPRRMHKQNRPQTSRTQMAGQTCYGVSGQQQVAQTMQAKDGAFPPLEFFPASQKND